MKIIGAALEHDVHVAGLIHFLHLAEEAGHVTINLGPAVPLARLLDEAHRTGADLIAVSYRLTPEVARTLFARMKKALPAHALQKAIFVFGGTPPVAAEAKRSGLFQQVFSGEEPVEEIQAFLSGKKGKLRGSVPPQTLEGRVRARAPFPLIRHHFGLPSLEETVAGVTRIAESGVLDILSIGPDQNAQESFFRPKEIDVKKDGAGGVPLRRPEDLARLYAVTRRGNHPLLRCYAGTRDLLRWAEMLTQTIHNAWGAIPLFWYSELDGRSSRPLAEAISENLETIRWHAQHQIPVEINDVHQWSLRYAPDAVAVADTWLCAYIAKSLGIGVYVAQYMWNTPPETTATNDLGKMLAQKEMVESLREENFRPMHMIRSGLMLFSPDPAVAKGQLATSIALALELEPSIVHVVGFSEADHAARPEELIESVKITQGVLRTLRDDRPRWSQDARVQARKEELLREARILLDAIRTIGSTAQDPFLDPAVLVKVIERGIFFAPHILHRMTKDFPFQTTTQAGCCRSANSEDAKPVSEEERLQRMGLA